MRLAAPKITKETVIAIDPGDLRKKYAKKMEFLGKVRDGVKMRLDKDTLYARRLPRTLNRIR